MRPQVAVWFAALAAAVWALAAPVDASAGDAFDRLQLAGVHSVRGAHALRLPLLRVPARPLPEPAGEAPPRSGPSPSTLVAVTPVPLLDSGARRLERAAGGAAIGGTLAGLSSDLVDPADAQIAVGPSDVVEMTNAGVRVWTTAGKLESTDTLGSYFTTSAKDRRLDQMTDPRIVYDEQSQRWFALAMDVTARETVLAISPTPIPDAGSWIYDFPSSGCPDQPRLGVADNLVAFGDNLFSDCSSYSQIVGGELTVLNKSDLMSGGNVDEAVYGPSVFFRSITPVVSLSSTGTLYFAASDFIFDAIDLFSTSVVQAGSLGVTRIGIDALQEAPDALQSDPALIPTGDNRVEDAVWENGQLWLAISDGCSIQGELALHACARYVGINTSSNAVTTDYEMALDADRDVLYPQIIPTSDGTLISVFGYTSASETPGIGVILNPQQATNWQTITAGTGANESGRWGDYFGIARDPSDPGHVWIAAAYGTGGDSWASTIAAIGTSPFTITPPQAQPPQTQPTETTPAASRPKATHTRKIRRPKPRRKARR